MLPALLTSVLLPVLTDLIKTTVPAVTRRWIGISVEDQIKLDMANVERIKALAELDNPYGTPSQLIVDLRGGFRYFAAILLIFGGLGLAAYGSYEGSPEILSAGLDLAAAPFGFIFGERLVLTYRGGAK